MEWTLDIKAASGGANLVTAAPFQALRVTRNISGPGSLEGDLTAEQVSTDWRAGTHRIVAKVDGTPWHTVYLTNLRRSNPVTRHEGRHYRFAGLGLASIFDWRLVRPTYAIRDDVDLIVESLLDNAQDQFNGDMDLSMGTTTGTFPERFRSFCFGQVIGDEIRELSQTGRGFDWEVDATGALNLWTPTRGSNSGFTISDENCTSFEVVDDTSDVVTTVTAIGDQSQPYGPRHTMVRAGIADTYGRHEVYIDVDSTQEAELEDAATAELKARAGGHVQVRTGWWEESASKGWAFGAVELGDDVDVVLESVFGGTLTMRCIEIACTADPGMVTDTSSGLHFVEHQFDALIDAEDIDVGDPDEGS